MAVEGQGRVTEQQNRAGVYMLTELSFGGDLHASERAALGRRIPVDDVVLFDKRSAAAT